MRGGRLAYSGTSAAYSRARSLIGIRCSGRLVPVSTARIGRYRLRIPGPAGHRRRALW